MHTLSGFTALTALRAAVYRAVHTRCERASHAHWLASRTPLMLSQQQRQSGSWRAAARAPAHGLTTPDALCAASNAHAPMKRLSGPRLASADHDHESAPARRTPSLLPLARHTLLYITARTWPSSVVAALPLAALPQLRHPQRHPQRRRLRAPRQHACLAAARRNPRADSTEPTATRPRPITQHSVENAGPQIRGWPW